MGWVKAHELKAGLPGDYQEEHACGVVPGRRMELAQRVRWTRREDVE